MKVLSSVSEEREGGSSESVAVKKKRMRERKKEGDGAIDEGCEGVLWCETKFKEEKGEGEWSSTGVDVAVDVSACVCEYEWRKGKVIIIIIIYYCCIVIRATGYTRDSATVLQRIGLKDKNMKND